MSRAISALVMLSILLVAGCAAPGGTVRVGDVRAAEADDDSEATSAGMASAPTAGASTAVPNAAVDALRSQAGRERAAGQPVRAAATLERALRIDARDPDLWHDLAELRLDGGDAAQAEQLARKSVALSVTDDQRSRAWRVVARALEQQGLSERAMDAWQRADGR